MKLLIIHSLHYLVTPSLLGLNIFNNIYVLPSQIVSSQNSLKYILMFWLHIFMPTDDP
jgi:hypothetical protein